MCSFNIELSNSQWRLRRSSLTCGCKTCSDHSKMNLAMHSATVHTWILTEISLLQSNCNINSDSSQTLRHASYDGASRCYQPISCHWSLSTASENIREPLVFCFQGVQKDISGMKWVNVVRAKGSQHKSRWGLWAWSDSWLQWHVTLAKFGNNFDIYLSLICRVKITKLGYRGYQPCQIVWIQFFINKFKTTQNGYKHTKIQIINMYICY